MSAEYSNVAGNAVPQTQSVGSTIEQVVNGKGTHPVIQDTKADFKGIVNSGVSNGIDPEDPQQPLSHFHNLFYDLFTWKFPKATGIIFLSVISTIFAFRFLNVLGYAFKGSAYLFAAAATLEIAGKPLGAKGLVSSFRPRRYYTIPRESLERLFAQVHELINFFVLEFQRVLFVENIPTTVAAFFASFIGYFLIKYIPIWGLLLLGTVTAFTAPLIYINNQEVIDAQIRKASDLLNEQLNTTKQLSEKYAGEAVARVQATTSDLTAKVQEMTGRKGSESTPAANGATNGANGTTTTIHTTTAPVDELPSAPITAPVGAEPAYPAVPTDEPRGTEEREPLLA